MARLVSSRVESYRQSYVCIGLVAVGVGLCASPGYAQVRTTERISTSSAGAQPGSGWESAISADGRYVVFNSFGSTFVPNDTNNATDVFVKDRQTNQVERVSVATVVGGVAAQGNSSSGGAAISGDGVIVAFVSSATNLVGGDTNGFSDVFVHDRSMRITRRVSLGLGGAQLNGNSTLGAMSSNGRYLTYVSNANNVLPGIPAGHLYRVDLGTGAIALVSQNSNEQTANSTVLGGAISADGRHVAFSSQATNLDLRLADTNGVSDVFVRDIQAGTTARVSVRTDGTQAGGGIGNLAASGASISGDGRFVAFAGNRLVEPDGIWSEIYVRDRDVDRNGIMDESPAGTEHLFVRTFKVSVGVDNPFGIADSDSWSPSISVDGRYVAFVSDAYNLVSPRQTFAVTHVYVRDLDTDGNGVLDEPGTAETKRVSVATDGVTPDGEPASNDSGAPVHITPNGRFIVFRSLAGNLDLVLPDSNDTYDIFLHDFRNIASRALPGTKPALSTDGRYLAFQSGAPAAGDTNAASDIFVRDLSIQDLANPLRVVRVSVSSSGGQANAGSFLAAISGNGRFVVFESDASNLVEDDGNGVRDVFLRDRDADGDGVYDESGGVSTVLISRGVGGLPGNAESLAASISEDGRWIAFSSDASNLVFGDTNAFRDIFVRDRLHTGGALLQRVNVTGTGDQAAGGGSGKPRISGSGRYVVFESAATNLVVGDTNGVVDIFARDMSRGTTVRISVLPNGGQNPAPSSEPAVSYNGELVVYATGGALVPGDGNGMHDIYGKPIGSGTTERFSIGSDGTGASGVSGSPAVSGDGNLVAFRTSASNLLPDLDTNGADDVYVRDRATNTIRLASVPDGAIAFRAFDPALSRNGRVIAFAAVPLTLPATSGSSAVLTVSAAAITGPSIVVQSVAPTNLVLSPTHGSANAATVVQITGIGLNYATRVTFNGTVGTDFRVEGDLVIVTAPPKPAGAVEVSVEIAGFQLTYVDTFTYEEGPGSACPLSAAAPSDLDRSGGQRQVDVNTPADCSWTAGEAVDWLQLTNPTGTGVGSFAVVADPNPNPAPRTGSVIVNGVDVPITQAGSGCQSFTVDPSNRLRTLPHGAGDDTHVEIHIGFGCPWTATSNATWLTVSDGIGPGSVRYTVTENNTPYERLATLTVLDVLITVVQQPAPPTIACTYNIVPPSATIGFEEVFVYRQFTVIPSHPSCAWSAHSKESWMAPAGRANGDGVGNVTFAAAPSFAGNRAGMLDIAGQAVTIYQIGKLGEAPFGAVEPALGSMPIASGAVALTGWALDDTGVTELIICRLRVAADAASVGHHPRCFRRNEGEPAEVYVGSALFVRGARPDIQTRHLNFPNNDRAGWGFMLLTNQLPESNGTFTFIFRARDGDDGAGFPGNVSEIGRGTIIVNNTTAVKPFGTLDTPQAGERIGGATYRTWGWALTPRPKTIPANGSISVLIDGASVGPVSYGYARADVGALFPGLNNSDGPVGFKDIDTRILSNGVHTISWTVTDNNGVSEGIGSRYFEVLNPGSTVTATSATLLDATVPDLPVAATPARLIRHLEGTRERVPIDTRGTRHVILRALDIAHLELGGSTGTPYEGYVVNAGKLEPLPIGSTFYADDGVFSWQLGPGFVGVYELYFVRTVDGRRQGIPVRLVVRPHGTAGTAAALTVDPLPASFGNGTRLSGSAVNGSAQGLTEIFAYAYPTDGSEPYFVGETTLGRVDANSQQSFSGQFSRVRFSIDMADLPAGTYDMLVFGRSQVSTALDAAVWVGPIAVR
jgi:Tol biopolymer transport system component